MSNPERKVEQRENPDFKLNISIYRHGPKSSIAGGLSEQGREELANLFNDSYENITSNLPEGQGVDIEHSPISRAEETATSYAKHSGQKIESLKLDERLSEGKISHHKEIIDSWGGVGGAWVAKWMEANDRPLPDVKTGQEAVKEFSQWLLEKIVNKQKTGGSHEIDAVSHGPLMLGFIIKLENNLNLKLLPEGWSEIKDFNKIINFAESCNFYIDSMNSNIVKFSFKGNTVDIPLETLKDFAK